RVELQTLQDYSRVQSVDPTAFPNNPTDFFWANDYSAGTADFAWQVSFAEGRAFDDSDTRNNARRCVRGGADPAGLVLERFSRSQPVAGQPIVVDAASSLVWQGCISGVSGGACGTGTRSEFRWSAALAYCEGLSWGGFDDWSLPNVVELASLIDHGRVDPPMEETAFPATPSLQFWTSTTYQIGAQFAWSISFFDGDQGNSGKDNEFPVRCVRRP
ncbi:MAG: DUF1566 domain-containing protein, partial [Myxococcota bacterium]